MAPTIRRAVPKDAAAFARLMSDPEVYGALLQMPFPSEERWSAMLSEGVTPGKPDLSLVAELDGEVVASAGLHAVGIALRRRHAMMMGISVAKAAQGQGVGTALMTALCDYADRWLGTLRIELTGLTEVADAVHEFHQRRVLRRRLQDPLLHVGPHLHRVDQDRVALDAGHEHVRAAPRVHQAAKKRGDLEPALVIDPGRGAAPENG
jgi:putative acetyltransferase